MRKFCEKVAFVKVRESVAENINRSKDAYSGSCQTYMKFQKNEIPNEGCDKELRQITDEYPKMLLHNSTLE